MMMKHSLLLIASSLLVGSSRAFVLPSSAAASYFAASASTSQTTTAATRVPPLAALFDEDDTSAINALAQFGPAPFLIRITQPEKFEQAVQNFQRKEQCSRVVAVRNMDAYFSDPNGWVLARDRAKKYGEVKDYTKRTGVQKRPVFSLFWGIFVFWFFLSFVPTRIGELGGVHPTALTTGLCPPAKVVDADTGKVTYECYDKVKDGKLF